MPPDLRDPAEWLVEHLALTPMGVYLGDTVRDPLPSWEAAKKRLAEPLVKSWRLPDSSGAKFAPNPEGTLYAADTLAELPDRAASARPRGAGLRAANPPPLLRRATAPGGVGAAVTALEAPE